MSTQTAVIIAAYNAEATLDRAVASALAQPETAEVCVVDDGSSDDTHAKTLDLAKRDPRVKALTQRNAGPSGARNHAIAQTKAPWITILDADDYMLEGRLTALHAAIGDGDFIADALLRVGPGAEPKLTRSRLSPTPLDFLSFVQGNLGRLGGPLDLGFLKPMFRRAFFETHQLRYREDMRLGEDYELYARALLLGARFWVSAPAGYISVEREGSLSKAHSERDLQLLRDCDDGLAAVRALAPEERRALKQHWNSVDCRLQWRRLITAVKTHDMGAAVSTFRSPEAAAFLATRLGEQAWLRGTAFARRTSPQQG